MVSTRLLISKSSSPCTNPLVTVQSAPITIGVTVTWMFHCFFNSQARSRYLALFSPSFSFTLCSVRTAKSHYLVGSLFLSTMNRTGHLAEIRWSVCISKSLWILCFSFSRTNSVLCIYHLFIWSNLNFLYNSQWITLSTQSYLVLNSLCANILHSLIMWFIVLSLS